MIDHKYLTALLIKTEDVTLQSQGVLYMLQIFLSTMKITLIFLYQVSSLLSPYMYIMRPDSILPSLFLSPFKLPMVLPLPFPTFMTFSL